LLTQVRELHPGIVLCLNENYGTILSEYVMSGRMDMAVLYGGDRVVHGLTYTPLFREGMFLATSFQMASTGGNLPLSELAGLELFVPRPYNTARQVLDEAFASASIVPRVIGEIESIETLAAAVAKGLGSAVMPGSVAKRIAQGAPNIRLWRLTSPDITIPLSHCVSSYLPLSESAKAVQGIVLELVQHMHSTQPANIAAAMDSKPPRRARTTRKSLSESARATPAKP
jgi:LysR family nitrogen assimilation transcriptional regulator